MFNRNKKRLGDILVSANKITPIQLNEALKRQKITGKRLGESLIECGYIQESDMMEAIEEQTGIEHVDLTEIKPNKAAMQLVSQNLCEKHELVPIDLTTTSIKVAIADPLNIYALDDVAIATGLQVETALASRAEIIKYIKIMYTREEVTKAAEQLKKETQSRQATASIEELDDIKNAPVVKMVDFLFKNSVEMRASDIHIEPYEKEIRIRYRIDGDLQLVNSLGIESLAPLVARIKILAGLNIAERRVPQDGRIITTVGHHDVDLRVSILPIVYGEKVVIRILNRSSYSVGRDRLGMSDANLEKLDRIVASPHGIVLVTGPTGSGKSTTLYTVLNELNAEDVNIVTVEDPVEFTIDGINQVNVNTKAGLTFASGLRSILRQDPDVVMIGEIRDEETAEIAVRAAITGHLVLSTLHTNDAPSTITRLVDMGIAPYLVATSLTGVIAQRLVKRVCPHCKVAYEASEQERQYLKEELASSLTLHRGTGCGQCNQTGYLGRTGVYEIMELTREHLDAIHQSNDSNLITDIAVKNGMITLAQSCKELVLSGVTTVGEMKSITSSI